VSDHDRGLRARGGGHVGYGDGNENKRRAEARHLV
jgi:hypothetical protein